MAFPNPRKTWVTGELITAAIMNAEVRDALDETYPAKVTTAGDLAYATAARTLARLGIGSAGQFLRVNSGATAPEWATEGLLFAQTSVAGGDTIANTASATNFATDYTLAANRLAAGRVLRVRAGFIHSTTGSPTLQLTFRMGTTDIVQTGTHNTMSGASNRLIVAETWLTCLTAGASGTIEGQGFVTVCTVGGGGDSTVWEFRMLSAVTVDTTASQILRWRVQWGTASASNTITMRQSAVELLVA
jgi:hypothetical protein